MAQRPMYQKIAEDLRNQIDSGVLASGAQLPTELDLCDRYGASRNTVRDAIKRLISQGLVETRPGQGTFVTRRIDPFVTSLSTVPGTSVGSLDPESAIYLSAVTIEHRVARVSTPKVEIQTPDREVAARLRLSAGKQVVSGHQERFIDELPWSLQTSFYPMEFVTTGKAPRLLMADNIAEGAVRYLQQAMNLKQTGYRDWITARGPDDNEQKFFGIAHDTTVFVIFRTGFDQTGTPMRVTVTIFPADRNQFIVDSGRVSDLENDPDADVLLAGRGAAGAGDGLADAGADGVNVGLGRGVAEGEAQRPAGA
jgi:GntR family transcriptional regulator